MKRTLGIITILALAAGMAINTAGKAEREDRPKTRFVLETLKALGGEHYPEKMKVKRITSVEIGDTYYHVFEGKLDTTGYHIIFFGNYQNYLGFYASDFPPCNEERDGHFAIDPNDVDEDGNAKFYFIPIDEKKGLPGKIQTNKPGTLVRAPQKEEEAEKTVVEDGVAEPEYRDWKITYRGKELTVRAIYVKQTFAKVYLKAEASGTTKDFDITSLSREDQAYVKQYK
jgi:hypothetical protein